MRIKLHNVLGVLFDCEWPDNNNMVAQICIGGF